jgi:hypothetical protein
MKRKISGVKEEAPVSTKRKISGTLVSVNQWTEEEIKRHCLCLTMKPHCPIHSTLKAAPAPGQDCIR